MAARKKQGYADSDPLLLELKRAFKKALPANEQILRAALTEELGDHDSDTEWLKKNFSLVVFRFEETAHKAYRLAEAVAQAAAFRAAFQQTVDEGASAQQVLDRISESAAPLDRFYLSVAQGRKARAGAGMEFCLAELFRRLGYPFSSSSVINGKPDFLFPSVQHYREKPTDCIVFTSKRTLRERWRQITTEGAKGALFFLATLDADVKPADLNEMGGNRVMLVVPAALRDSVYAGAKNVISFEDFILDQAEPAMARWRRNGVIS